MVPLCRVWLRDEHLKEDFRDCLRQAMQQDIARGLVKPEYSAADMLVFLLRNIAHSNAVLTAGKLLKQDRNDFWSIVRAGRLSFQRLCDAAIFATSPKSRRPGLLPQVSSACGSHTTSRASSVDSQGVEAPSIVPSILSATENPASKEERKKDRYTQFKSVPNVNIGHHYVDVLSRYGLGSLLMVFAGEQKHK